MKRLLTAVVIAASESDSWADGLKSLVAFMKNSLAGRADFTVAVTAHSKDGQPPRTPTSRGQFDVQRPGKFRVVYTKPFEQTIVADGKTLWLYDADLNQVTQRPQAQALGSTPAAILASASDLKALSADFDLQSAPEQDGLQWVQANPRDRNGQLKSVRVGFASDGQLAALDILDSFGQRSLIRFTQLQTQASLPASTFEFKVPAGADVLKQ
jgi:outer membrane lipoprotein carrier protein